MLFYSLCIRSLSSLEHILAISKIDGPNDLSITYVSKGVLECGKGGSVIHFRVEAEQSFE